MPLNGRRFNKANQLRIIVTGLVGQYPVGGVAWDYLQYVIGLARLGHDVYYHEDTWSWPYQPMEKTYTDCGDYSAQYIGRFFERYAPELCGRWHYRHLHSASFGMGERAFAELARTADLFLNISGACIIPDDLSTRCVKLFVDTDPGYNQIMLSERFDWSENVERWCASVAAHDRFFTYAENIHGPDCGVPKMGLDWKPTRMPVVMSLWQSVGQRLPPTAAPWTTIMTWNAFKGRLIYEGVEYKSKGSEFEKLIHLPNHISTPVRVAVGGVDAPLERLASAGWQVVDGPRATLTPQQYQQVISESRGELSVAKHVYVALRTGWFSCRSACYLAAGRPVVVQDTGFATFIPVGEGVLPFSTAAEALAAIHAVEGDHSRHAAGARAVAEECFDSGKVLSELIDQV
jgi:hypothetical protein